MALDGNLRAWHKLAHGSPTVAIPHRLHHVWLGPDRMPERWHRRWQEVHPGWDVRLWREADVEPILPPELVRAWRHYLGLRRWHGAADVARLAILLREGGVYVDIDSEPVRPFGDAPFMAASFFGGLSADTSTAWVSNGTIGAEPGHRILVRYAELVAQADVLDPPWSTIGARLLTVAVREYAGDPDVALLPTRTFYPEAKDGEVAPGDAPIYARHFWATTHELYGYAGALYPELLARRRRAKPGPIRRAVRRVVPKPVRQAGLALIRRAAAALRG